MTTYWNFDKPVYKKKRFVAKFVKKAPVDCTDFAKNNIPNYNTITSIPEEFMEMDFSETKILDKIFAGMNKCVKFPDINAPKATSALAMFESTKINYIPNIYIPNMQPRSDGTNSCGFGPNNDIEHAELSKIILPSNTLLNITSFLNSFKKIKSILTWFNQNNFYSLAHVFSGCTSLSKICYIDTKNVQIFNTTFHACSSLTEIEWEINMQCATDVTNMFLDANIKDNGITLINVPRTLNLSNIGIATTKYIIKNYIDAPLEPSIE